MANQKIRNTPDWDIRSTGGTKGWQQGSQPSQSGMGTITEPRASPPDSLPITQGRSR